MRKIIAVYGPWGAELFDLPWSADVREAAAAGQRLIEENNYDGGIWVADRLAEIPESVVSLAECPDVSRDLDYFRLVAGLEE
jgi:hypothetical protein